MMEDLQLDIQRARQTMAEWPVGHTLLYDVQVATTMIPARAVLHDEQYASGVVCVTEEQTAGKGRLARSWQAPAGTALLSTTVLKAPDLPATAGIAPMLAGVSAVDAITSVAPELAARLALKWPNDVLVLQDDGPAKVAGILVESSFRSHDLTGLLLGIGINVNQRADQLPAPSTAMTGPTSIRLAAGRVVARTDLLIALCDALGKRLTDGEALFRTWRTLLHTLGQQVTVTQPGGGQEPGEVLAQGMAVDVLNDGSLVVEESDGQRIVVASGDVTLRQ